jgi:molybdate transport system substrate-binding protein
MKKMHTIVIVLILMAATFAGCTPQNSAEAETAATEPAASSASLEESAPIEETAAAEDLSGHSLMIYCGAGMKKPFQEIADTFMQETGCDVQVNFANAAQIQSQINTAQEGDLFIAGSAEEVKPVQDNVTASEDLVKHIPVLVVQTGNPKGITGLSDLTGDGIGVVFGDAGATPIGKISDKALEDLGISDQVDVLARAATAPEIMNALAMGQCDAAILWKENAGKEGIEIVPTGDLDKYVKTVPAASLSFNTDREALDAFLAYLNSNGAKDIWIQYGYEILN